MDYASMLALQNVSLLGVNATADSTNKLTVASAAVLFNNIGNGVQAKLNKHAAADTASLLYQTNFSGRAEVGLTGDDNFHFKVSPDGSTFYESLILNRNTGSVLLKHIDITAATTLGATHLGRMVRADATGGAFNATLPATADADDWVIVRKKDSGANRVTVKTGGGSDVAWLSAQYDEAMFAFWDGAWTPVRWKLAPLAQVFTSSGTWTKPPLAKWVSLMLIGAGGGGGSGRRGAAASIRAGGQGGVGGVLNRGVLNASDLSATEMVTVGAGGTSGAAQTTDSTDGNAGGTGGNSTFGSHLLANGGTGGAAGGTAAGTASTSLQAVSGAVGLGASANSVSAVSAVPTAGAGTGTGGNGGSITAGNADFAGSAGANGSTAAVTRTNGGAGGASAGGAGGNGDAIADTVNQFGGAGGGGGGGYAAGAGGAGGSGGTPGGGGGGGGASVNGNASGAGGVGGRGEIRITTHF